MARQPRLAFQTYAVRDLCAKDFVGTLKAARAMGYEGVEWLVVKPTAHPDSLADLEASIKFLIVFNELRPVGNPGYRAAKAHPCERCGVTGAASWNHEQGRSERPPRSASKCADAGKGRGRLAAASRKDNSWNSDLTEKSAMILSDKGTSERKQMKGK